MHREALNAVQPDLFRGSVILSVPTAGGYFKSDSNSNDMPTCQYPVNELLEMRWTPIQGLVMHFRLQATKNGFYIVLQAEGCLHYNKTLIQWRWMFIIDGLGQNIKQPNAVWWSQIAGRWHTLQGSLHFACTCWLTNCRLQYASYCEWTDEGITWCSCWPFIAK